MRALPLLLLLSAAPGARAAAPAAHGDAHAPSSVTADDAMARLRAGNRRFASGRSRVHPYPKEVRASAGGQHPFAAVLACMDSRVGPELVFDQGIGDLFSLRVAGNVADDDALAGLEYATKVSGAHLIVVLGHTHCGAVKGACEGVTLGHLPGLLAHIKPAVDAAAASLPPGDERLVERAARENVLQELRTIREKSPVIADLERHGEVRLVGALYDVETGRAEFFP